MSPFAVMKHSACTSMMRSPVVDVLITMGSARGVDGSLSKSGTPESFAVLVMRLTCPSWWYLFAPGTLVVPCANAGAVSAAKSPPRTIAQRSEEHTSELQSRGQLVCRLLLEKKKYKIEHV